MRKFLLIFLIFVLIINPTLCYGKARKLLFGLSLIGSGIYLAINNFSIVEKTDEWDVKTIVKEWDENEQTHFITYKIVHHIKYFNGIKDFVLGSAGLSLFAIGTCKIINYFKDLKKTDIKIKLIKKKDATYLLYTKRF